MLMPPVTSSSAVGPSSGTTVRSDCVLSPLFLYGCYFIQGSKYM